MFDIDELLQRKLDALEKGSSLEGLTSELPSEQALEIESLLRLATAVRQLPHPKPVLARLRAQKYKLMQTVRQSTENKSNGRLKNSVQGLLRYEDRSRLRGLLRFEDFSRFMGNLRFQMPPQLQGLLRFELPPRLQGLLRFQGSARWALAPALAGILLLAIVTGIALSGPSATQTVALVDSRGDIEVFSEEDPSGWEKASNGDKLQGGQRLRTGPDASVTLAFFEGSRTTLGPNTDLTLTRVDGGSGKTIHIVLQQNTGQISNHVIPFRNPDSSFMVLTPSSIASVHGTEFEVAVDELGKTRFNVDAGKVLVTNESSEVFLTAGQAITADQEEELGSPDYQFSLQGELSQKSGSTWTVAGVAFSLAEEVDIEGNPQIGEVISVQGRILENGAWLADQIELAEGSEEVHSFTGILDYQGAVGEEWQIGDWNLLVNRDTQLGENLQEGSPVEVTFTLLDGRWVALSIEALEEPSEDQEPTPTPDPEALPVLSFNAESAQTSGCGDDFEFSATLTNEKTEAGDFAANISLSSQVTAGQEYVNTVEVVPSAWDRIEAGESQELEIKIRLDEEAWQSAPLGTEVAVKVFVAEETNNPDGRNASLTVTILNACENAEEPSTTETPEVVETQSPQATEEPITDCTGTQSHPTGLKLADRFDVDYEEIMSWFCQRFGFGEIDLAYSLSDQYNVAVEDIFALKSSGMGWGQIKKIVSTLPTMTPTPEETITEEVTEEPTETPTPSETPEPEEAETETAEGNCTGNQRHPTGERLAFQYGVDYEVIMGWFCQGFGFGEIDLAYSLSLQSGLGVENVGQIFAMKSSGMGWGQIKKEVLQTTSNSSQPGNSGKPDKPDKPGKNKNKP